MDRRAALARLGLGAASIVALPRLWAAPPSSALGVEQFAEAIAAASRGSALASVARARYYGAARAGDFPFYDRSSIYAGVYRYHQLETVFQAVLQAGALEVRPGPLDAGVQAVLAVPTVRLTRPTSPPKAWLAAVWCAGLVKSAQARDRRKGNWELPARRSGRSTSVRRAMTAFDDAMTRWDAEAADAGLIDMLGFVEPDELFHLLWPYAARCFVDQGQKIVMAAQVHRHASSSSVSQERVLRWLVRGLLYEPDRPDRPDRPDSGGRKTEVYERSRSLVGRFPVDWSKNKERPARSVVVLRHLRGATSHESQDVIVAAIRKGLGADTVWDALSLYASEIALQRSDRAENVPDFMLPLIEVNALRHAYRHAWHPATRKLLLLQSAGWLPLLRDAAVAGSRPLAGVGIEDLGNDIDARDVSLRDALASRSPARLRVGLDESRTIRPREAFDRRLTEYFISRCADPLQYQYAFAAYREVTFAARRWRSRILAPIVRAIPVPQDPETDGYREARRIVRSTSP